MSEPIKQEPKSHYWLIPITLVYRLGVTEKQRPLNVLLRTSNQFLNLPSIGRAQQLAQMQARETKAIEEKAVVVDAVINGASYIGFMSDTEFNTPTEGQAPLFAVQDQDEALDGTKPESPEKGKEESSESKTQIPADGTTTTEHGAVRVSDAGGDTGAGTDGN